MQTGVRQDIWLCEWSFLTMWLHSTDSHMVKTKNSIYNYLYIGIANSAYHWNELYREQDRAKDVYVFH